MGLDRWRGRLRLVQLSARQLAGRRYWVLPLLPLLWTAFQALLALTGGREEGFTAASAQNTLIGLPLTVLALGLGVRVIAGELDRRSLELAYTVPGGSRRLWQAKLVAAAGILLAAEALLAAATWLFFVSYPLAALYGAFQAAAFYLVLAMGLAALLRSEVAGALATAAVLTLNLVFQLPLGRISPFWNPTALDDADAAQLLAWAVQNRVGYLLAIAALTALAFARAERREKMLAG